MNSSSLKTIILLCVFVFFNNFKPLDPYLTDYLLCSKKDAEESCEVSTFSYDSLAVRERENTWSSSCSAPCEYDEEGSSCSLRSCEDLTKNECGSEDYDYCEWKKSTCKEEKCYKNFTTDEINNLIYPFLTFSYLPFLLILGPLAELYSYRLAIFLGMIGRVACRVLLLYGKSITSMQLMETSFGLSLASDDVLTSYIYYIFPVGEFNQMTSIIKATNLFANVVSSGLSDVLVIGADQSLTVLLWINLAAHLFSFSLIFFTIKSINSKGFEKSPEDMLLSQDQESEDQKLIYFSNSSTSNASSLSNSSSFYKKCQIFYKDILSLKIIFKIPRLFVLTFSWIVGNSIYTLYYNYEVSIYEELYGSNKYNGLVLGLMLLIGTFGAILPEFIPRIQLYFLPNSQTILDSKKVLYSYILIFYVISSILLILSTVIWNVYVTITLLSIFFGLWQACTVIIFSEIAQSLKNSFETISENNNKETIPPFSFTFVLIIAINVVFQIIIQGLLFTGLEVQLQFASLIFSIIFIIMTIIYFITMIYTYFYYQKFFDE